MDKHSSTTKVISQRVSADYKAAGIPLNSLASKSGLPRTTLRRKLDGHAEFKFSELLCIEPHINGSITRWLDGLGDGDGS